MAFVIFVIIATSKEVPKLREKDKITNNEKAFFRNTPLQPISENFDFISDLDPSADLIKDAKRRVNIVKEQFAKYWSIAWISYALVYIFKLFESHIGLGEEWNHFINNFLNNLGTSFFLLLFLTFHKRTISFKFHDWLKYFVWLFLTTIIELYYIISIDESSIFFSIISGIFAAVVLCAFIGAIDSKVINFPYWLIIILYAYAASQVLYFISEHNLVFDQVIISKKEIKNENFILDKKKKEKINAKLERLRKEQNFYEKILKNETLEDKENQLNLIGPILFLIFFILKYFLYVTGSYLLNSKRLDYFVIEESALNFKKEIHYNRYKEFIN